MPVQENSLAISCRPHQKSWKWISQSINDQTFVKYAIISSGNSTATFSRNAIAKMKKSRSNDHFIDPERPILILNCNKGNAFRLDNTLYFKSLFGSGKCLEPDILRSLRSFSTLLINTVSFDHFLACFNSICYKLIVSGPKTFGRQVCGTADSSWVVHVFNAR